MTSNPVPNDNNLDVVRFSLASMVFISHLHDLSGIAALSFLSAYISSTLAVQAFFVISGFLIFQSYDRSSSVGSYIEKRIRRIIPVYVTVIFITTLLLSLISKLPITDYFTNPEVWKYFAANLVFLNFLAPDLPGVFASNIVPAVNGALWTLKIEAMFYIAVPICAYLFGKLGRSTTLVAIYVLSVTYTLTLTWLAVATKNEGFFEIARQLPGQMVYFIAGAAIYFHFSLFSKYKTAFALVGIVLFVISAFTAAIFLRPIAVALLIMSIAFGPFLGRFGRYGDFSYSIYIVHFPILQALISLGLPQRSVTLFVVTSVFLVMIAAFAMWHLVEKRFLRRDSHYRREADGPAPNAYSDAASKPQ